jgi:hypothetical protein
MNRFGEGEKSRIILTRLMNMATSLGVETVTEGVETREQARFLKEIGCTRLQGYYYSRPLPFEEIEKMIQTRTLPDFENPDEAVYYGVIGRIGLYDLSTVTTGSGDELSGFLDTLPMAIVESDGSYVRTIRCNRSYRSFIMEALDAPKTTDYPKNKMEGDFCVTLLEAIGKCRDEGSRTFIDESIPKGSVHSMVRHVAVNPVTGTYACLIVVLKYTPKPYAQ